MAADPNPTLRAQLEAALAVLAPQIRVLHDLAAISIPTELRVIVNDAIATREPRRDLILEVIAALDAVLAVLNNLEGDGFPDLPNVTITPILLQALHDALSDLNAGASVFAVQQMATELRISIGAAVDKS